MPFVIELRPLILKVIIEQCFVEPYYFVIMVCSSTFLLPLLADLGLFIPCAFLVVFNLLRLVLEFFLLVPAIELYL